VPEAAAAARSYSRFALALVVLTSVVDAKEVTLSHKGLTLNANLELAAGKTLADGAVLLTHGSLAHNGMEIITYFQSLLKEKGYNTLAINLSLGLDNRHGMYDCKVTHRHRHEDAAEEIGVWVNWLKQQGAKRVTVMGHSCGGTQTALYAAGQPDAAVNAVVLLAPATRENNDAARYQQLFGKSLAPWVERARQRVQDGQGGAVMEHTALMTCAGQRRQLRVVLRPAGAYRHARNDSENPQTGTGDGRRKRQHRHRPGEESGAAGGWQACACVGRGRGRPFLPRSLCRRRGRSHRGVSEGQGCRILNDRAGCG